MVILCRNKNLIVVQSSNIYKYETGVDTIDFLIPQFYEDIDLSELTCIVEVDRPYQESEEPAEYENSYINEAGEKREKIFKYFEYEETSRREGYLEVKLPITTALTLIEGEIQIWLKFIKADEDASKYAKYVLVTAPATIPILPNDSLGCESKDKFDEIWEHTSIDELKEKLDNLINFDFEFDEDDDDVDFEIDEDDDEEDVGEDDNNEEDFIPDEDEEEDDDVNFEFDEDDEEGPSPTDPEETEDEENG